MNATGTAGNGTHDDAVQPTTEQQRDFSRKRRDAGIFRQYKYITLAQYNTLLYIHTWARWLAAGGG